MAGGMKRLAKDTAVYGLSSILGRMLNWLLVPMYSRVLAGTYANFGVMTNLYGWIAFYWLPAHLWNGKPFFPVYQ